MKDCLAGGERLPFPATLAAEPYDQIRQLPVSLLLDNVRSLYNVGSFFRIADAARLTRLYLCGITGCPPKPAISKTALGAELSVAWEHHWDAISLARRLREDDVELVAVETTPQAVDLFDWRPRFPVCVVFGHEVDGIQRELAALCDACVRIPMLGRKHSLNVATAGGVVVYELLRKYRRMMENAMERRSVCHCD